MYYTFSYKNAYPILTIVNYDSPFGELYNNQVKGFSRSRFINENHLYEKPWKEVKSPIHTSETRDYFLLKCDDFYIYWSRYESDSLKSYNPLPDNLFTLE